jgi:hypothetical protein
MEPKSLQNLRNKAKSELEARTKSPVSKDHPPCRPPMRCALKRLLARALALAGPKCLQTLLVERACGPHAASISEPDTSRVRLIAGIGIGLVVLAGCGGGRSQEALPVACKEGPGTVMKALAKAPAAVTLDGSTPISRCFNRDASGDDVQIVGTNLLAAAQQLGDRARAGETRAALQLGYLIGAARKGAKRNGLGAEIVRRLEVEAAGASARPAAYDRGLRAGLNGG